MDSVSLTNTDTNEYDEYVFHDSDDDDDAADNLDNNDYNFNETWKINKKFIEQIIGQKGVSKHLIFYGKNLIIYYQNRIAAIKKLLESKGMDNTKNFVGDVTIQNEQRDKIKDIKNNSLIEKTDPELLDSMFSKYYYKIGNHADEVMDKDYENRHKTIMYDLLIKEYELNIEQIKKTIQDYDEEPINNNEITDLLSQFGGDKKFTQNGGLVYQTNIDDINQSSETFEDNTSNAFSMIIEEYNLIQNDLITNPLVITQILDIMLKIRNAENNPSLITDRYFNLHELKLLFLKVSEYEEVYNLEGGNPSNVKFTREEVVLWGRAEVAENVLKYIKNNLHKKIDSTTEENILKNLKELNLNGEMYYNWTPKILLEGLERNDFFKNTENLEITILVINAMNKIRTEISQPSGVPDDSKQTEDETDKNQTEDETDSKQTEDETDKNQTEDEIDKKQMENIEKMKDNLEFRKYQLKIRESKVARLIEKLQKDIKEKNDEIEKIKMSEIETKEKEKKIQDSYHELLNTVKESMKNIMDFFQKQTNTINEANMKLILNISKIKQEIEEMNIHEDKLTLINENYSLDLKLHQYDIEKCEKQIDNTINNLIENKESILENFSLGKKLSPKEHFYHNHIANNFLKKNLYNFILECKKLDSIPQWRANISQLIVGYLSKYVADPNSIDPNNPTYVTRIPTYDIFNIIIMGTPGVGKSFTADIIGKALKYSGLLTKGDRHDIKKPDIVGSYTGQTAPKVYKEFTECLGKVIFIDEAYSIAGAKDETKGTFNEFGQESLDALTDYTSEHIGFSAFVAAGYEYEMNKQFLEVNIGLPRRFPTQLILKRYSLNSFWKILSNYLIKFVKKTHLENHHKACFELLNLLFNFQCGRNPTIQLPKNWISTWKSHNIKNIHVNLEIDVGNQNKIPIPFLEILDFDELVRNTDKNVTSESVIECISREFLNKVSTLTKTFIKSYVLYHFCGILNGDLFRSQADNLTKFSQYILEDKIINNSGKYNETKDIKFQYGDTEWIENCYFNLYFTKNPNYKITNINYEFSNIESQHLQGGKRKIDKISKNNKKKINRRSRRKEPLSIIDGLLRKINNKLKGGKPENTESSDIDDEKDIDELIELYKRWDAKLRDKRDVPVANWMTALNDFLDESFLESDSLTDFKFDSLTDLESESLTELDSESLTDLESDSWDITNKYIIEYKLKLLNNFEADAIYEEGLKAYNDEDFEEAANYFLNALEISNVHGNSYYMLAKMKYNNQALELYNLAALNRNIQSNFLFGCIYYYYYKFYNIEDEHFGEIEKNQIIDLIKKYFDIDILTISNDIDKENSEKKFIRYFTNVINDTSCILGNDDIEFVVFKLVDYYNSKMFDDESIVLEDKVIECLLKVTETSSLANKKLGEIYTKREDIDNALKYYEQSAKLGDIEIPIILGDYYNAKDIELSFNDNLFKFKNKEDMDLLKSKEYYKMSIDKLEDPVLIEKYKGLFSKALYKKYNDVKNKYEYDIYQKLLLSEEDSKEQFNIGKKFLNGEDDYSQNIDYGLNLIIKSADNNYPDACFYYAKFLYDELPEFIENKSNSEVLKIKSLVKTYFQKASDLNHTEAIYYYADILFNGLKIENDKNKAVILYKKGAELGDARCQLIYAILLLNPSEYIEKVDDHQAFLYLQMATENSETKNSALENLKALNEQKRGMKELNFILDIKYTNITLISNVLIRISKFLNTDDSESNLLINPIFQIYNDHSVFFELAFENNRFDEFKTAKFIDFVKVYILLKCYNEAINQSEIPDQKFTKESWWFYSNANFQLILEELDIKSIMKSYNDKYKEQSELTKTEIVSSKKKMVMTDYFEKRS